MNYPLNIRRVSLNCKSYVCMGDLAANMCEKGVAIALLQEPYVAHSAVRGLPATFRVYTSEVSSDGVGISAVAVNDANLVVNVMAEFTNRWGIYVKGANIELYVVSVYCRFGEEISPYLQYLENVRMMCAVSAAWFSKGI